MIRVFVQKVRPLGGSTPPLELLGSTLWLTWLSTRTSQWTLMEDLTVNTVNVTSQKPLGNNSALAVGQWAPSKMPESSLFVKNKT